MLTTVTLALLVLQGPATSVALPDTPQGKHVAAWIAAFNSGDEKTFVAAHHDHMVPEAVAKHPDEDRAKMFQRLKGDFGTFVVRKVVKAAADQIVILMDTQDGNEGTFTFDFEAAAPYRISGIGIDVRG